MIWVLLYLYVVGVINDFMFAIGNDADLKDWRVHANIAAWPITVPAALIIAMTMKGEG